MILHGPHAEFEIKAAGISRREYEPGCLELRLGAAVDLGGSPAIVVYGDPGEPESALQAALSEELCRIWCRDVWGWTDQAAALDQKGGVWTGQQVSAICAALHALKSVRAIGRSGSAAQHEFRDPLVPAGKPDDEQDAADKTRKLIWNADGIFERHEPEQWGPQYQPLDGDDEAYGKYIGNRMRGALSQALIRAPIRSSRPWLLADLPHEYDAEALLHIEKWLKTRDPIGVLT
jgi:hypothetical protein